MVNVGLTKLIVMQGNLVRCQNQPYDAPILAARRVGSAETLVNCS